MNPLSTNDFAGERIKALTDGLKHGINRGFVLDALTADLNSEITYLDNCQRELKEAQDKRKRINAWVPSDSAEVIVRRRMLQQAREDITLIKEDIDGGKRRLRAAKVALKEIDARVARIHASRKAEIAYIKKRQKEDAVLAPHVDAIRLKLKSLGLYEYHWEYSNEEY